MIPMVTIVLARVCEYLDMDAALCAWTNGDTFTLHSHTSRHGYNECCYKEKFHTCVRTRCNIARHAIYFERKWSALLLGQHVLQWTILRQARALKFDTHTHTHKMQWMMVIGLGEKRNSPFVWKGVEHIFTNCRSLLFGDRPTPLLYAPFPLNLNLRFHSNVAPLTFFSHPYHVSLNQRI